MTTGFSAGIESNSVGLAYAPEATWGVKPAVAFQALRFTSESFSGNKSRSRPNEIRQDYQSSAAITTQETASAGFNLAMSYGTYDDLLAGLLMGTWAAPVDGTSRLTNGTTVTTYWFQKQLATDKYLVYPATYFSSGSLSASTGQFLTGSFSGFAQSESKATTNGSTGAVVAAPDGRVIDNVAGFQALQLDGDAIDAVADAITINISKEGAAAQYGLGSADAQGMLRGTLTVTGTLRTYFRNFDLYDKYKAESLHEIAFTVRDLDDNAYTIILPSCNLMNPQITAGGPGQSVMAEFALEAEPGADGYTIAIDRTPAA